MALLPVTENFSLSTVDNSLGACTATATGIALTFNSAKTGSGAAVNGTNPETVIDIVMDYCSFLVNTNFDTQKHIDVIPVLQRAITILTRVENK